MGLLSKVVGSVAKVATGGLGGIAGKALGGLLNKSGLGGILGKLFGGGAKGGAGAGPILNDIKNLLSQLVSKLDKGGGQCSHGNQASRPSPHQSPSCMEKPGMGHAQECGVNIPGHSFCGNNDVMYGGPGNDTMYGGSGNDVMYGDRR